MASERSKRRDLLACIFITKSNLNFIINLSTIIKKMARLAASVLTCGIRRQVVCRVILGKTSRLKV